MTREIFAHLRDQYSQGVEVATTGEREELHAHLRDPRAQGEVSAHYRGPGLQGAEAASKAQTPTLQEEIEVLTLETENLLAAARELSEALAPVSEPQADKTQAEVSEYPTTGVPMIDAVRAAYRKAYAVRRLLQETQSALRLGGES